MYDILTFTNIFRVLLSRWCRRFLSSVTLFSVNGHLLMLGRHLSFLSRPDHLIFGRHLGLFPHLRLYTCPNSMVVVSLSDSS